MPIAGSALGIVSSVAGGLIARRGAKKAARAQTEANNLAKADIKSMLGDQLAYDDPYARDGFTAQNRLMELAGLGGNPSAEGYGSLMRDFSRQDMELDPGYAFRQEEGQRTIDRSAAARGALASGGTLKALARFGQDLASQEYGNAFNRFQTNRSNKIGLLTGMTGAGQAAGARAAENIGTAAERMGAYTVGAGQARASGYVARANALNNALENITNIGTGLLEGRR